MPGVFEKITGHLKDFKPDTTAPPDDKMTRAILELRQLRGGFNINEAVAFKIQEDRSKNETPKKELDFLQQQFETGKGKRWLENAATHIYRQHFTYKEMKQMIKFYKTSAGQKMAVDFPVILLKSLVASQFIHDVLVKELKSK